MVERTPVRLLVVEDDEVDRLACRRALTQHPQFDFELLEAETAREGLQLALTRHPECILLDYRLPDMDGLEFLAELCAEGVEFSAPVLMLTGAAEIGVAVEAMRRGARDYLVKDNERRYLEFLPAVIERAMREERTLVEKRIAEERLREAEVKYRTLVEHIPAITYVAAADRPGHLIYVSPQVKNLGFSPQDWLASAQGVLGQIHPDDRERVLAELKRVRESSQPLRCEYRLLTRRGDARWYLDEARVVHDAEGRAQFVQGFLVDIHREKLLEEELRYHRRRLEELVASRTEQLNRRTELLTAANTNLARELEERQRAENALRASEERFRQLLESAGEGIFGLDTNGRCTFVNQSALDMLGFAREEIQGQHVHAMIHHSHADGSAYPEGECPVLKTLRSGEPIRNAGEVFWRRDGDHFPVEYSAFPVREGDRTMGAVLVFRDVTESQALTRQLSYQATHDALTGLVNRHEFERRLERVLADTREQGGSHALCYLDLDRFKVVNDSCGHRAGDQLLRQLGEHLQDRIRGRDTLARLGGDEFGVLLEHCPLDQAIRIATELRETVRDFRFQWEGKPFQVGASVGVVTVTAKSENAAAALGAADAACYAAKEQGRNRVHVYEPDDVAVRERRMHLSWVSRLTRALDEDRLRLYYQSIVPLAAKPGARPHYEILLRLVAEDGSLVDPDAFLAAAERYNLMPAIDRWVVRHAIATYARRENLAASAAAPIYAVNLSSATLADEGFARFVGTQLAEHKVPGSALCFEIAEAAALAHLRHAVLLLQGLKQIGCLLTLDDFGRGLSSFSDLKTLPVDFIKIDGGFVRTMTDDPVSRAIAGAINHVAHVMAARTIAENAETEHILAALRALGVDHAQGYAIMTPQPLEVSTDGEEAAQRSAG
jgi:diguanylate cyclase (GGDEF)-like protein/PAS domain S-box-containing protein